MRGMVFARRFGALLLLAPLLLDADSANPRSPVRFAVAGHAVPRWQAENRAVSICGRALTSVDAFASAGTSNQQWIELNEGWF